MRKYSRIFIASIIIFAMFAGAVRETHASTLVLAYRLAAQWSPRLFRLAEAATGLSLSYIIYNVWHGTSNTDCSKTDPNCYTEVRIQNTPDAPADPAYTPPPASTELAPLRSSTPYFAYKAGTSYVWLNGSAFSANSAGTQAQNYFDAHGIPAKVSSLKIDYIMLTNTSPPTYFYTLPGLGGMLEVYQLQAKFDVPYTANGTVYAAGQTVDLQTFQNNISAVGQFPTYQFHLTPNLCDTGYTFDGTSRSCKLTNASVVGSAPDNVCPVSLVAGNYYTPTNDPDCTRVKSNGNLTTTASQLQIKSPDPIDPTFTNSSIVSTDSYSRRTTVSASTIDSQTSLSQNTSMVSSQLDGSVSSVSQLPTTYTPSGSSTSTPVNTVISYPAQGTGAVQCGGAGMPACAVSLDAPDLKRAADAAEANTAQLSEINRKLDASGNVIDIGTFDSFKHKLDLKLSGFDVPVSSQCPRPFFTLDFDFLGSPMSLSDGGGVCDLIQPFEAFIRLVSLAAASAGIMFIVLRA